MYPRVGAVLSLRKAVRPHFIAQFIIRPIVVYGKAAQFVLATKDKTVNDPYDFHPNHPANATDPVARYAYICPNQFAEVDEKEWPKLDGKVDCELDSDEAEAVAQELADSLGIPVTVEIQDEEHDTFDTLTVKPTLVQEMNGPDEGHELSF